jgi:hypothetical protein
MVWPALALAQVLELGRTPTPIVAPVCPKNVSAANCTIILTRTTAVQTIRDGVAYPHTVKQAGQIVAFTVGLSALSKDRTTRKQYIHNLDTEFGGVTLGAITVLRPVPRQRYHWRVVAESPFYHLQPYLGQVVQFPLQVTLPVQRGDVVALSTPTWAPVLSIQVAHSKFAYRQSRSANCNNPPATQQAQPVGGSANYACDYPGTRVEYSATEVTSPTPPKNYVHEADR